MSLIKTTEEFSSRRKVRYGAGSPQTVRESKATSYGLSPGHGTATLSPHKASYGRDRDNNEVYIIQFNIGDFRFDEITIRTEGRKLIVTGKSQVEGGEELSREFKREFTLPEDVDQHSIRAQLDEATRQLSLIGQVKPIVQDTVKETASSYSSSPYANQDIKLGTIKETRNSNNLEYEIFLGNELRDGQVRLEVSGTTLIASVLKKNWDKFGDYSFEFKRQLRLPSNANTQRIEQQIDYRTSNLVIRIPFN